MLINEKEEGRKVLGFCSQRVCIVEPLAGLLSAAPQFFLQAAEFWDISGLLWSTSDVSTESSSTSSVYVGLFPKIYIFYIHVLIFSGRFNSVKFVHKR